MAQRRCIAALTFFGLILCALSAWGQTRDIRPIGPRSGVATAPRPYWRTEVAPPYRLAERPAPVMPLDSTPRHAEPHRAEPHRAEPHRAEITRAGRIGESRPNSMPQQETNVATAAAFNTQGRAVDTPRIAQTPRPPAPTQQHSQLRAQSPARTPLPQPQPPQPQSPQLAPAEAGEHVLAPLLRWSEDAFRRLSAVDDYTCTFIKRERVSGELLEHQSIYLKVRHRPFSAYLYFQSPQRLKGQEALYVRGRNDGNLLAHATGIKSLVGTMSLAPTSPMAMQGNRHPITDLGMLNLVAKMVTSNRKQIKLPAQESVVKFYYGAKVGDRSCTCVEVSHPRRRAEFDYHMTRTYVDESNMPIRFEGYAWPQQAGGSPLLMEEYTYVNPKFNNGYTDADFDVKNPSYGF